MLKKHQIILISLFCITLAIRLILAFSTPEFTYESYYHFRHVENILETGFPIYDDVLSYGGRTLVTLPLFHYLASLFSLVIPIGIVAKILTNTLFASLGLVVFSIARQISRKKLSAIFSAIIAFFLPITFQTHSFTPLPLALLCIFLSISFFLKIIKEQSTTDKKTLHTYILILTLLLLTSPLSSILLISLLMYSILSLIEEQKLLKVEREVILFSLFFFLWVQFILFKDIFLKEGLSFIWQSTPPIIVNQYLPQFALGQISFFVGFIPFITGIIYTYTSLFTKKSRNIFLFVSTVITSILLAQFRIVPTGIAMAFLGLVLAILFAPFYDSLINYYHKSKLSLIEHSFQKRMSNLISIKVFINISTTLILLLLLPTMLIPAISVSFDEPVVPKDTIKVMEWLENTPKNSVIISDLKEGHLITSIGKRQNVMDSQYALIPNVEERFLDIKDIYSTSFETFALKLLEKYSVDYIVFTKSTKEQFNIEKISYINTRCFELVYNENNDQIYKVTCNVRRIV